MTGDVEGHVRGGKWGMGAGRWGVYRTKEDSEWTEWTVVNTQEGKRIKKASKLK